MVRRATQVSRPSVDEKFNSDTVMLSLTATGADMARPMPVGTPMGATGRAPMHDKRPATFILGALLATTITARTANAAAAAGDARSEVIALAHRAMDAFNKGDMAIVSSLMASGEQSIID